MTESQLKLRLGERVVSVLETRLGSDRPLDPTELAKGLVALDMLRNFVARNGTLPMDLVVEAKMLIELEDIL